MAKKKIAILGSGCSAMAAAHEITNVETWDEQFEVTVYTLGWRLGGKGASGRNPDYGQRIEEHGLHVWLGFYDNAFRMIKEVYAENDRPIDAPLATWQAAFTPTNSVINVEPVASSLGNHWTLHAMELPLTDEEPGTGREIPGVCDAVRVAWSLFSEWMHGQFPFEVVDRPMSESDVPPTMGIGAGSTAKTDEEPGRKEKPTDRFWPLHAAASAVRLAKQIHAEIESIPDAGGTSTSLEPLAALLEELRTLFQSTLGDWLERHDYARTFLVYSEFFLASVIGAIRDGAVESGWDAIDDYEFWQWLSRHGCDPVVKDSAILRALYDFIFAYPRGDRTRPTCAASTMMRLTTRMWLTYRGAMFWRMNAGMGDTIFAPMYEVLEKRGVRFEFFSKVVDLAPDIYGTRVESVTIQRQVELKDDLPGDGQYQPLVDVKGLPCWPSRPDWSQIRDGEAIASRLAEAGLTLESAWCKEKAGDPITLEYGRDFDAVVLGIPVAALPAITQKLAKVDSRYRDMLGDVKTVETYAAQVWMQPTLRSLGWKWPPSLLAGGRAPYDTYADMAHLLPVEDWKGERVPQDLAYFCGVADCPATAPLEDEHYPRRTTEEAYRAAVDHYREAMPKFWPHAADGGAGGTLEWRYLHAAPGANDEDRFASQFWRANVSPDQRYTLALPGLNKHRLVTNETHFFNLFLVGDWTLNGLDAGTVEGSVMSGMQAAREICGRPATICGETALVRERIELAREGPVFVDIAAPQQIPGPVGVGDMTLYAFVLEASRAGALQSYVDRTLNQPCKGALRYEVLMEHVIAFMAPMARTWSMAPGLNAGWIPETDCGFWIPVARVGGDGPGRGIVEEVLLYPVALYVDQPYTQISGREIYGYPKGLGKPKVPTKPDDPGPFWIETILMRDYDPKREFLNEELWRIERTGVAETAEIWRDGAGALAMLAETFLGDVEHRLPEVRLTETVKQLEAAPSAVPMVFLKQFRDACGMRGACYQAIVENLSSVTKFDGMGLMPGTYRFKTVPTESVGIIDALGLREEMNVIFACWSKFDMIVGPGRLRWEAR